MIFLVLPYIFHEININILKFLDRAHQICVKYYIEKYLLPIILLFFNPAMKRNNVKFSFFQQFFFFS